MSIGPIVFIFTVGFVAGTLIMTIIASWIIGKILRRTR